MLIRRPLAVGDVVKLPPRAIRYEILQIRTEGKHDFYTVKCLGGKYKNEIFESRLIGWKRTAWASTQSEKMINAGMTRVAS